MSYTRVVLWQEVYPEATYACWMCPFRSDREHVNAVNALYKNRHSEYTLRFIVLFVQFPKIGHSRYKNGHNLFNTNVNKPLWSWRRMISFVSSSHTLFLTFFCPLRTFCVSLRNVPLQEVKGSCCSSDTWDVVHVTGTRATVRTCAEFIQFWSWSYKVQIMSLLTWAEQLTYKPPSSAWRHLAVTAVATPVFARHALRQSLLDWHRTRKGINKQQISSSDWEQ
jgi:hypothetical protein